jgi:hypothetical protein
MRLAEGVTVTGDITISDNLILSKISDDGVGITLTNDSSTRTITGSGSIEASTLAQTPNASLTGMTGALGSGVTGGSGLDAVNPDVTTFARYSDFNGHGSTDTKIMKWSDEDIPATNSTVVTVSQSAANGLKVTANMNCFLFIHLSTDWNAAQYHGFSKNSNQLTTTITSINHAHVMIYTVTSAIHVNDVCSWSGPMTTGDIIRPHSAGVAGGGNPTRSYISIFAIKKY